MTSAKSSPRPSRQHLQPSINRRALINLIIVGLVIYVVLAGIGSLHGSGSFRSTLQTARSANVLLLVAALIAVALSYAAAATTYLFLTPRPLRFRPTLLVQISGGVINRLLPGGLGGLGMNALYLKKQGCPLPVATTVVAINNILGLVGNAILVSIVILVKPMHFSANRMPSVSWKLMLGAMAILLILSLIIATNKNYHTRARYVTTEVWKYIILMLRRPGRSAAALMSSMTLTSLHASALYLVLWSLGAHTNWAVALLVVSAGSLVGAAVPTPGGIGGAEAGIAATLVTLNVPLSLAVGAAVIYRGLTYWLPLVPGYIAFRIVEKRYL